MTAAIWAAIIVIGALTAGYLAERRRIPHPHDRRRYRRAPCPADELAARRTARSTSP